ncbi:RNA 2',3'-cyclic phosphodiesterase [Adhaeribacter aquaticus]|uniref:RNA 2',3'-cyclic phosphodiesterase n=1 Tax=Adhaeribacter aquaticus TaxID=299567 RepID=UPI000428A6D5|nr:RNA 2',3'-cyclic phosphodiesterase [Adhaeribacter aquaticus]
MRLFIAVPLDQYIKLNLVKLREGYKTAEIRFIPEENLHLTLHFIGDYPENKVPELAKLLQEIASFQSTFDLTFQEIAPGPTLRSPRLIWARFQENKLYEELATKICAAMHAPPGAHGKFIPHVTLARFRKDTNKPQNLSIITSDEPPVFSVTSFALWSSELQTPHPRYSIIQEFNFGPPASG